jgi:hypothetical protein
MKQQQKKYFLYRRSYGRMFKSVGSVKSLYEEQAEKQEVTEEVAEGPATESKCHLVTDCSISARKTKTFRTTMTDMEHVS